MREPVRSALRELVLVLADQQRAVDNARRAATALSQQRVEREEVELYLEAYERAEADAPDASVPAQPQARVTSC